MSTQFIFILGVIVLSITSCKKESFSSSEIPTEFTGPVTVFVDLHDTWEWLYSDIPSTIGPPVTGPMTTYIWNDSMRVIESYQGNIHNNLYLLKNTLEPDSIPHLHYFDPSTGEYISTMSVSYISIDTIQLHIINSGGGENDAVFKRN